jgi:hypothetical protein
VAVGPHDYTAVVTEPTCIADGYTTHTCNLCGNVINDSYTAANGSHDIEYHEAQPVTCIDDGWDAYETCSRCDYTTYSVIKASGEHTEVNGGTKAAHKKCSVCNDVLSTAHSYTSAITTTAKCNQDGIRTYSCGCGYSYTESIGRADHSWTTKTLKAATCTQGALKRKECTVCGTVEPSYYSGSGTGHSWINNTANKTRRCKKCGITQSTV